MQSPTPEFHAVYKRVFEKWTDDAMSGLSPAERDFVIANACLNQSLNAGLMSYYEFSQGNHAGEAAKVLRRLGLAQAAEIVEAANRLMGPDGPAASEEARGGQLDALTDEKLDEMARLSDALNGMADRVRIATLRRVSDE